MKFPSSTAQRDPQDPQSERSLLGGLLLDNRKFGEIIETIPQQARGAQIVAPGSKKSVPAVNEPLFSQPANQIIFQVAMELYERDRAVDLTTLGHELDQRNQYEAVGGAPYLTALVEEVVSTLYLPDYAQIVVEMWRLRSLLRVAETVADEVLRSEEEPESIMDRSAQRIFDLSQQVRNKDFVHVSEVVVEVMDEIEERAKDTSTGIVGLKTGFKDFDRMTTGLRPANLVILAARPSMGKSAFAMNIVTDVAVKQGLPVGVFSLEMSAAELNQRILCTLARVQLGKVRGNRLNRTEIDSLHQHAIRMGKSPLYIDDSSDLSVLELRARARRLKAKCPDLGLIVVDYLQLMHGTGSKVESRQQEVASISRALKVLAGDLQIPIIALSQLSRASEQRSGRTVQDRMPKLSDLRESGAIEQDADMVLFIHREAMRAPGEAQERDVNEPDIATIRIGKQRNGPIGDFNMLFFGHYTEFVDASLDGQGPVAF